MLWAEDEERLQGEWDEEGRGSALDGVCRERGGRPKCGQQRGRSRGRAAGGARAPTIQGALSPTPAHQGGGAGRLPVSPTCQRGAPHDPAPTPGVRLLTQKAGQVSVCSDRHKGPQ